MVYNWELLHRVQGPIFLFLVQISRHFYWVLILELNYFIIGYAYVHRVIFLNYYQIVASPCLKFPWLPLAFRIKFKLISTHIGLTCPGIPWPWPLLTHSTLHRLISCHIDLLFHSWSMPRSPPTWYASFQWAGSCSFFMSHVKENFLRRASSNPPISKSNYCYCLSCKTS